MHRMKDLCRYMNNFDNEAHAKYKNQVVYSTMLVFFKNAFQYVNSIQPSLFQGWFRILECPGLLASLRVVKTMKLFTLTLFLGPSNCQCFYELLVFMYVFTKNFCIRGCMVFETKYRY